MGQALAPPDQRLTEMAAFRRMVLRGAERLRRRDVRDLADALHALARSKSLGEVMTRENFGLKDDGLHVWL